MLDAVQGAAGHQVRPIEEVLRAIDRFQDCCAGGSDHESALGGLADSFGAAAATCELIDRQTGRMVLRSDARIDPAAGAAYLQHYHALSPRVAYGLRGDAKPVVHDGDVLTEAEMARDPFYNEFLPPLGLRYFLSVQVDPGPDTFAVVAFQFAPGHGFVQPDKVRVAAAMRPLLARALRHEWVRRKRSDGAAASRDLRRRFGLTAAEASLAQALLSGISAAEHAERRGISRNTAYTHYARLKAKLGCRRQVEVMRKLHALDPD